MYRIYLLLEFTVPGIGYISCFLAIPSVVCMTAHVLFTLFVLACFHHIMCCVVLFVFVLCTLCCQFLWIVHFVLPLRFSNVCWLTNILILSVHDGNYFRNPFCILKKISPFLCHSTVYFMLFDHCTIQILFQAIHW